MSAKSDAMATKKALQAILLKQPIAYHVALARIGGGVTAGLFLSQLLYWSDKGKDQAGWIYKTADEWEKELGMSRAEQTTARRNLKQRGLMEEKLAGIPATLHFRICWDALVTALAQERDKQDLQNVENLNGTNGQSIPETTAETTAEKKEAPPATPAPTAEIVEPPELHPVIEESSPDDVADMAEAIQDDSPAPAAPAPGPAPSTWDALEATPRPDEAPPPEDELLPDTPGTRELFSTLARNATRTRSVKKKFANVSQRDLFLQAERAFTQEEFYHLIERAIAARGRSLGNVVTYLDGCRTRAALPAGGNGNGNGHEPAEPARMTAQQQAAYERYVAQQED